MIAFRKASILRSLIRRLCCRRRRRVPFLRSIRSMSNCHRRCSSWRTRICDEGFRLSFRWCRSRCQSVSSFWCFRFHSFACLWWFSRVSHEELDVVRSLNRLQNFYNLVKLIVGAFRYLRYTIRPGGFEQHLCFRWHRYDSSRQPTFA